MTQYYTESLSTIQSITQYYTDIQSITQYYTVSLSTIHSMTQYYTQYDSVLYTV